MTEYEKEDLLFWFYSAIFGDGKDPAFALNASAAQLGLDKAAAEAFLREEKRLKPESWELSTWEESQDLEKGIYPDFDWMAEILIRKAGLKDQGLYKALGIIFCQTPADAEDILAGMSLSSDSEED